MSSSEDPPCELPTSCCGTATTKALPPLLQIVSPELTAPRKLDTVFSEEMLAGGYRKKYLRATSRLLAELAPVRARASA